MNPILRNVALGLTLFGLASCSQEAPWGNGGRGKGTIDLKLAANADVEDALPSVRSGAPELEAPDVEYFAIEMRNLDTDQTLSWRSLEDFNNEPSFDVGSYILTAYYGSEKECGFNKPYFKGEAAVNVLEGRQSDVEVVAQLANVMMSVDYTDAFKEYFQDYKVTAHTDGHANVIFGKNETRAGFLTAGNVTLEVTVTNPSGKTATVTPATFPAVARHHYHVTFDVNADPMGSVALEVIFDDSLTQENVTFTLSDELFNAEAPIVSAEGFTSGTQVEALSGNPAPNQLKFEANCKGGIQSAVLKIAQLSGSETYSPVFGSEIDLMQADEATQNQLKANGIEVAGIFKNPETWAIVDVTKLPTYLPLGTYEITFTVKDRAGRTNEGPVTLKLATLPIKLEVIGGSAIYQYTDPNNTTVAPTVDATVKVTYNGLNPETAISFMNTCSRSGKDKKCVYVDHQESAATRGFDDKNYIFHIKVCDVETSPLPMKLLLNGKEISTFTIDVIEPEFSLLADPFATYARFKVQTEKEDDLPTILNGLNLYVDGKVSTFVTRDLEKGILNLDGLTSNKEYTIGYSLTTRKDGVPTSQQFKIKTETAKPLDNGNFSAKHKTIDYKDLPIGGQYTYKLGITYTYTNVANVVVNEPDGWASINAKTFYTGAKNINSWYTVVSTFADQNGVTLRSVAYDHAGKSLAKTATESSQKGHYCKSVPTKFAYKSAGELFLGNYSFTGTEDRKDGISFGSRPKSLSFDCSYAPYGADMGLAKVEVLDASGKVIASGSSNIASSERHTENISLDGYPFGSKAASIRIQFKSSRGEFSVDVPNPIVDSWDGTLPATPYKHHFNDNDFSTFSSGSVLTIDNVKLNY